MQKNEKSLGGGEDALAEGALGPRAADGTMGLFLLPDGRGAAPPERKTKLLQPRLKPCSYCREGGRDPGSPLGILIRGA
jgi:hypothetical protein